MTSTKNKAGNLSKAQLNRLVSLGKLWADAALFHPFLAHSQIDWDKAFVETIPRLEKVQTDSQYAETVNSMLAVLQDFQTYAILPDQSDWKDEANKKTNVARKLFQVTKDFVAVINLKDVSAPESWSLKIELTKDLLEKENLKAIVLDMRNGKNLWVDTDSLIEDIASHMCTERAIGPALRSRMYCGFAPEAKPNGGHYFSGYSIRDAFTVEPKLPAITVPIVFLINSKTRIPMAAYALQSQPNVFILSAGELDDDPLAVDSMTFPMPGGVVAKLRLGEWIFPDGHIGFVPDKILKKNGKATGDRVLKEAILFAASKPRKQTRKSSYAIAGTETAFRKYWDMVYPSKPYRLLALFRIWSIFNYFFPYKDIMGEDWDQVLLDFIPRFENAKDARDYGLAVCEMITHVHDSHAGVYGGVLGECFGFAQPPIRCRIVEGQPVVTEIWGEDFAGKNDIAAGDIVKTVGGVDVDTLLSESSRYISASTPQSLEGLAVEAILTGAENSTVTVQLEDGSGRLKTIDLLRKFSYWQLSYWYEEENLTQSDDDMFKLIGAGDIGYCDLRLLTPDRVDKMFDRFKSTRGIIFDMRGYPQITLEPITAHLTSQTQVVAGIHSKPLVTRPFGTTLRNFKDEVQPQLESSKFLLVKAPSTPPHYQGETVMLIDERAVSQAEQTGLFLKAANDTKFVGSPTAGANGTITSFWIPGGLCISFTGEIICHPDGTQLQRRGLQPHITVIPTIAGIRAGKDEVLAKAIAYLESNSRLS